MASLQDQLLKAGLINKNKANKAKKEKQKQAKAGRGGAKTTDETGLAAQQEQARKVERDRELNRQKQARSNQKAMMAQIKQLIDLNRVDREGGDVNYSFVHNDKVKKIFVTPLLQNQLGTGRLAIVTFPRNGDDSYELVPAVIAEKIAQRDQNSVVQLNQVSETEIDEDDPYADYQIPDDLMW
ncbi:MAG: DUF2058 domain-containing protein [Gammaproteobacteria bacterium]|nr:DUF2058 domain-containing protein [Gammaproteobacteria bacterium]